MSFNFLILPVYVSKADGNFIRLHLDQSDLSGNLQELGFRVNSTLESRCADLFVVDDLQKAKIFSNLRNLGFPFSKGREWSPSEVFQYLRDKKMIDGEFKEIFWRNPEIWSVRDR